MAKETSQNNIAVDTMVRAEVANNIIQVEKLLGCINQCHVFWTALLLKPTVAT